MAIKDNHSNVIGGAWIDSNLIYPPNMPPNTIPASTTILPPGQIQRLLKETDDTMHELEIRAKDCATEIFIKQDEYEYTHYMLSTDTAVKIYKDYNPMNGHHPDSFSLRLLKYGMGVTEQSKNMHITGLGTQYYDHDVDMSYNQLTAAGLAILEYWSKKHKEFKKFFNAYVPALYRHQIREAGVDMALGQFPKGIRNIIDADKELQRKQLITEEAHEFLMNCDFKFNEETGDYYLEYDGQIVKTAEEFFKIMADAEDFDTSNAALIKFAQKVAGK